MGASIVELEVLTGNDAAARLYERSGFVDVGPGEIEGGRRMVATR